MVLVWDRNISRQYLLPKQIGEKLRDSGTKLKKFKGTAEPSSMKDNVSSN